MKERLLSKLHELEQQLAEAFASDNHTELKKIIKQMNEVSLDLEFLHLSEEDKNNPENIA